MIAPIVWNDLIRGEQRFDPKLLSDPVVRREDGSWLYLLPSVIDDVDLGITHVVRGEDHVSNSAAQIQMFEALGAKPPSSRTRRCWSPPRASCRSGSAPTAPSICVRRASSRWRCCRCSRGSARRSRSSRSPASTRSRPTSISRTFGRAPAHFDPHEVELVNARLLHGLDYSAVADRLPDGATEEDWLLLRPNLERLADFADWFDVLHGEIDPPELSHDERLLVKDAAPLPNGSTGRRSRGARSPSELKQSTGKKGPRTVPSAPAGAHRPRERSGDGWPRRCGWARNAPPAASKAAAKR